MQASIYTRLNDFRIPHTPTRRLLYMHGSPPQIIAHMHKCSANTFIFRQLTKHSFLYTYARPSLSLFNRCSARNTHTHTHKHTYVHMQLQDQVPAFPTDIAQKIIERELGQPADRVFQDLTKPIAAASLGQVYRARLASGENKGMEVAVKVQRPDIMECVALDMHLIRSCL
jgi:hypothetical protein